MEQTAVQLMSRKQRAAKLLTGDIGLTGLDALTEGEGGFEEALLDAIGRDEALLDPSELFRQSEAQGEIDTEDAAYWNVELTNADAEPLLAEAAEPFDLEALLDADPVIQTAIRLGGVIAEVQGEPLAATTIVEQVPDVPFTQPYLRYLDSVQIVVDEQRLSTLYAELIDLLNDHPASLAGWLRDKRVVFPGCEDEVAAEIIRLAQHKTDRGADNILYLNPISTTPSTPAPGRTRKRQPDLLAVPDDVPEAQSRRQRRESVSETAPLQLALF